VVDITDWRAELMPALDQAQRMARRGQDPTFTDADRIVKRSPTRGRWRHVRCRTPVGFFDRM